ncbi:Pirin [hydrothermal vent metagenome]|uniref:Pirin n=1 Tax=hydrothermal vent metagenome TaxID=652676 RepID=A0A3B0ZT13_9ZZZZ
MTIRQVERIIKTTEVTEGAGVTVHRSIGTSALRNLDPFVMLDHFGSDNPDEYIAGFPEHPHRGFNTFTYMLDGNMEHRDSMGNTGNLTAGSAQWMKAGSGVIHSEMPKQVDGLMRGFQLWINLPASSKMTEPSYQEYAPEYFPVYEAEGQKVKVLLGQYQGVEGPIDDAYTNVSYFDVELNSGKDFDHVISGDLTAFIYLFEGDIQIDGKDIKQHSFVNLGIGKNGKGDKLVVSAISEQARFILVAGRPIGEPIVQYGPFVMNSQAEVHQAMADYRDGKLVQQKAEFISA